MTPDTDFFALSYAELKAQVVAEHNYGHGEWEWRAIYQTPAQPVTPCVSEDLAVNPVANSVPSTESAGGVIA